MRVSDGFPGGLGGSGGVFKNHGKKREVIGAKGEGREKKGKGWEKGKRDPRRLETT